MIHKQIGKGIQNIRDLRGYKFYKPLYAGLKKHRKEFIFYNPIFMLRRVLLFTAAAYLLPYGGYIQVVLYIFSSLINAAALLHIKPFKDERYQQMEIVNELAVLATCTMCLWFTGYIIGARDKVLYDHLLKWTVLFQCGYNLFFIVMDTIQDWKESSKESFAKMK